MPERNLCKEAGCSACCCDTVYFHSVYHVREVLKVFPGAKKVRELSKQTEDGVYYDNFLGLVTVRIVGCCPSLDSDGNCLIYRGRRLSDCETMDIGSDNCVLLRRAYEQGLKINT